MTKSNPPVVLVWKTEDADELVAYMARVSAPDNQGNTATAPRLIKYLMSHGHWSPFEMVNFCVEINTSRDIARQILRHRSFSFQEFSQRYAEVDASQFELRDVRLQDTTNRQASILVDDPELKKEWEAAQQCVVELSDRVYREFLDRGVAKEVARSVLPEGLTGTRMYMNGTLRSWIHYWDQRCADHTQLEHREIAKQTRAIILSVCPQISEAYYERDSSS